ncbi:bifunctional cystathionine gamma-lyase/homocysteine desulfhydrase [Risungbinella massiliensis]|uniref:bifunctional cystathionine gamma-lyase/homocysteine desulfhydrase n=1 Tax=Risungbinella massiliensis TaxID=1329796 RepID=UPI0005CC63B6|nr:bifunctional cystathionine gamma-lyase/homocysteine desulfhydrase [Risungbinella massiliensis]
MKKDTLLIHGGVMGDKATGAVSVPIYQVSTFAQDGAGKHRGYEYARTGNPTRDALERLIADLESGSHGLAFASGMAAMSTVLALYSQGDHLVMGDDVYGGTYRVLHKVFSRLGITHTAVDTSDPAQVEKAIQPNTKAILVETPTNPLLKVTDLSAIAKISKAKNLHFIVDNTFMTPYWQNPLTLGADIVVHSATKYLGGHSDVVSGLVVVNSEELAEQLYFLQNSIGAVLGPHDSWLLMRGIKTLGLRMKQHEQSARRIAEWLADHPKVQKVFYPGLSTHPGHLIAAEQANGFGGMISFEVQDGEVAEKVLRSTKYFVLAESLGAVESLISLPAKMTHASIPAERRQELGITDGLIRISVGVEDVEDLIEDLSQALSSHS